MRLVTIQQRLKKLTDFPAHFFSPPKEQVVVFVHIPKCGGTTISHIAMKNYNFWRIFQPIVSGRRAPNNFALSFEATNSPDILKISHKITEPFRRVSCILGHIPYGVHVLLNRPCFYFTFLRNPISRVLSQFNHIINAPEHYLYAITEKYNFDLGSILQSEEIFEFCNDQARMLLGSKNISMQPNDIPQVLAHADNCFDFIGTVESFDICLDKLQTLLRWQTSELKKMNAGTYSHSDSLQNKKLINLIAKYNQIDIALYEHVSKKLSDD